MTTLQFLTIEHAEENRTALLPLVERILVRSGGRLECQGVSRAIADGSLWVAVARDGEKIVAALLCKPINWNTGINELELVGVAGDGWENWIDLEKPLADSARALGFHIIGGGMRPGLAKALADRGWKTTHVYAEKVLHHA